MSKIMCIFVFSNVMYTNVIIMVARINLLLQAKNITARQFAEEIGIQPSGMSHILSGRNNPSLDFVMKVIKRWPEVNINWLMFGQGEMFAGLPLSVQTSPTTSAQPDNGLQKSADVQTDLFSQPEIKDDGNNGKPIPPNQRTSTDNVESAISPASSSSVLPQSSTTPVAATAESETHPASLHQIQESKPSENRVENANQMSASLQANVVNEQQSAPKVVVHKKKVVKMIVLYDDHSFTEYYPE